MFRIGSDIGGTFTDFVVVDDQTRELRLEKTLTTPHDPSEGIFTGLSLLEQGGVTLAQSTKLVHGTTLVINALIEQKGVKTALLTTAGFRDVIEMRNELRYDVYDLQIAYPKPLVPRALRFEVSERTAPDGRVLQSPDAAQIAPIVAALRAADVKSVAICFLHAYANPANERAVARWLIEQAPELAVSLSSDVLPQIKEYERTSTTVANAYVKPVVAKYLQRITDGLSSRSFGGDFYVMQSGGGVVSTEVAQEFPVKILESGPAGGVAAARWWGELVGLRDLLCFDMGGTTAKLCTVARGEALVTDEYEAARVYRFKRGSGFAISVPVFDLLEIGTGGGSLARIDHLGLVKVGPHSAGAVPGPACYGRGGVEPTVTDADLVLGYLDPDYFLGGSMRLLREEAIKAVQGLADRLPAMEMLDAAYGIHEIANEDMASAARLHLAERGEDVGALTMIAYGGAGPVHAYGLAQKLGIKRLIVPPAAGVMSALGMLVEDLAIEKARTMKTPVSALDPAALVAILRELSEEACALLQAGARQADIDAHVELRYRGQGYNIRVALPGMADIASLDRAWLVEQFETHYRQQYGRVYSDVEIELVNVRVVARLRPEHRFEPQRLKPNGRGDIAAARKGTRHAYFGSAGAHDCPVFDRYRLHAGHSHRGAAFIEERETTTLVGPKGSFSVNEYGMLVVEVE